jgi:two-component system, chemotaxis family, chemotaxis protein CheY
MRSLLLPSYISNEPSMPADKSIRVLIVDDYKTMVRIVRNLVHELGFANIDDTTDGPTALDMIRKGNYGLVLSDWNMQPLTGYDLLKAVRADERTKDLPFVLVTAEAKTENVVAAKQAGANNYIIKPFTLAVLKQKLTSVLGEL